MDRNLILACAINIIILFAVYAIPYFGIITTGIVTLALQICACAIFSGEI